MQIDQVTLILFRLGVQPAYRKNTLLTRSLVYDDELMRLDRLQEQAADCIDQVHWPVLRGNDHGDAACWWSRHNCVLICS